MRGPSRALAAGSKGREVSAPTAATRCVGRSWQLHYKVRVNKCKTLTTVYDGSFSPPGERLALSERPWAPGTGLCLGLSGRHSNEECS